MATAQPARREQRLAFWWTALVLFACWNAGTFLGALLGSAVDTDALGLDAAGPAVFLALVWPAFRQVRARWVGLAGAAIAVALVPVAPSGVPVLAAAVAAVVGGLRPPARRRRRPHEPLWVPVLVACAGSYLIKLAGLSLPSSVLADPRVQRVTTLLPVAMLSALVCVQLVEPGSGGRVRTRSTGGCSSASPRARWRCCCAAASSSSSSSRSP